MRGLRAGDAGHLRRAIALSRRAGRRGNEPYGALLADARGRVVGAAQNTQGTRRDVTGHAEINLVRRAARRLSPAALARCTLYASGEPCPMCAGAIYWANVRRVVFALEIATMRRLAGAGSEELLLPCREVFARGTHRVEVVGPALRDEAAAVLREHYRG